MKLSSPYPKKVYQQNAQIYRLLGNPLRLEMLNILKENEATVDELSETLGIRKANTSQHLSVLKHLHLVEVKRVGRNMYYHISDPKIVEPCKILQSLSIS